MRCSSLASAMCCRSPVTTWRWWPAWCSLRCALLALIPGLTVSFPIKKWSAAAALAAAAFYLLLSGAEVATQRSFFMTAVVLIAIMVDRRAVTFRTLAVAAMIVLAMAPEALVHPSFQSLVAQFSILPFRAQKPL